MFHKWKIENESDYISVCVQLQEFLDHYCADLIHLEIWKTLQVLHKTLSVSLPLLMCRETQKRSFKCFCIVSVNSLAMLTTG